MTVAATILSVGTALLEGVAGMSQANYQAKVADMNQEIANENAQRTIERSQVEAQEQDYMTLAMLGEQEAAQASSGTSMTGRNATKVRANARTLGRLDSLRIKQAGELEAHAHRTDAANFAAAAEGHRMSGGASLLGGFLGAGKSLISGASKVKDPQRFMR